MIERDQRIVKKYDGGPRGRDRP